MGKKLNEDIATIEYDNLFYSDDVKAIPAGVIVASGQGKLKRGTLLSKNDDGKCCIHGTLRPAGYVEVESDTEGALKVVSSNPSTGEIAVASVTPVVNEDYTPAANDYVIYQTEKLYEPDCILTDEVDATSADADAIAYIQGDFNINELSVAEGYTISQADKDTLRTKNILIGRTLGY